MAAKLPRRTTPKNQREGDVASSQECPYVLLLEEHRLEAPMSAAAEAIGFIKSPAGELKSLYRKEKHNSDPL